MLTFCNLSYPILISQNIPFSESSNKAPTQNLNSNPTCMAVLLISLQPFICKAPRSSFSLLLFSHFILAPQTITQNSEPVSCLVFFSDLFVTTDISDHTPLLKISSSFSFLTYPSPVLLLLCRLTFVFSLSPLTCRTGLSP